MPDHDHQLATAPIHFPKDLSHLANYTYALILYHNVATFSHSTQFNCQAIKK